MSASIGLAKNMKNVDNHSAFLSDAPNVRVDAAARIQSSIAGRIKLRNTLPPIASDYLLGRDSRLDH
jgi:hypothetical protein